MDKQKHLNDDKENHSTAIKVAMINGFATIVAILIGGISIVLTVLTVRNATPTIRAEGNIPITFCEYAERFCNPAFILADSPMYSTLAVFFVIWLLGTLTAFYIVIRSYLVRRREFKEDMKQIDEMIANSDTIDAELEALQQSLEKQHEKLLKIQRATRLSVTPKVQPDA